MSYGGLSHFCDTMNVFILSTGRCGSTTFAQACQHMTNFSAAHESRISKLHDRLEYPDNHIEVDNRLSWFLGRLDRRYGDDAFYVHLKRDREATAESYARRYEGGIMKAYRRRIIWRADDNPMASPVHVCRHYVDTVNSNIELFLKDKTRKMEFRLESAEDDFREFWGHIGAEGDLSASLQEWSRKYNASDSEESPSSGEAPTLYEPPSFPVRVAKKAVRAVLNFPKFLRKI